MNINIKVYFHPKGTRFLQSDSFPVFSSDFKKEPDWTINDRLNLLNQLRNMIVFIINHLIYSKIPTSCIDVFNLLNPFVCFNGCQRSSRKSTTLLTEPKTKNSPYSNRVRAIDYAANNLVNVALPAFLSAVIFLAFWNLDNAESVPFPLLSINRTSIWLQLLDIFPSAYRNRNA